MRRVMSGMRYTLGWINEAREGNAMAEKMTSSTTKTVTRGKPVSTTETTDTTSPVVTGNAVGTATPPRTVQYSPRMNVLVNSANVDAAFRSGDATQSVGYVQHALTARGFTVPITGSADYATRSAYAKFQQSINERPTGLPTFESLDILGFDVT